MDRRPRMGSYFCPGPQYVQAAAVATVLAKHTPMMAFVEPTKSHVAAMPLFQRNELQFIFVSRAEMYLANRGAEYYESVGPTPIRVAAAGTELMFTFFTSPQTGIEMAELVSKYPDRCVGAVACMPMNEIDAALKEAERTIDELGFRGVEIFTDINDKPVDADEILLLYGMMETYDLPVVLHPRKTNKTLDYPGEETSKYLVYTNFGWPYATSVAMARIAFGVFVHYPKLKVLTHHGGGMIPFSTAASSFPGTCTRRGWATRPTDRP